MRLAVVDAERCIGCLGQGRRPGPEISGVPGRTPWAQAFPRARAFLDF